MFDAKGSGLLKLQVRLKQCNKVLVKAGKISINLVGFEEQKEVSCIFKTHQLSAIFAIV